MRFFKLVLASAALAIPALAFVPQDPMRVDPSVYHLKLENERVRVFIVTFAPGRSIGVHKHPDHVVHAITSGKLMIHEVGKDPVTMDVVAGATLFLPAQSHSAKNVGKTNLRLLVVELK